MKSLMTTAVFLLTLTGCYETLRYNLLEFDLERNKQNSNSSARDEVRSQSHDIRMHVTSPTSGKSLFSLSTSGKTSSFQNTNAQEKSKFRIPPPI